MFPRHGKKVNPIFINQVTDRDGRVLEQSPDSPGLDLNQWVSELNKRTPPGSSPTVAEGSPEGEGAGNDTPFVQPDAPALPSVGREKLTALQLRAQASVDSTSDQVLDPRVAYVMTHIMKEVVSFGTGYEAKSLGRVSAGKTGTTNDYLDAWYMGFTPQLVTGVWVGYDSQKPIGGGETGARAALPIWLGYMKEATKNLPVADFAVPAGITFTSIDPNSGRLLSAQSAKAIQEAFITGTEPGAPGVSSGVGGLTEPGAEGLNSANDENSQSFLKEDIQ